MRTGLLHPLLPFVGGEVLDGVAEGGARHVVGVATEEVAEEVDADALAHFAQHPPDGFVHEVVGMVEVDFGVTQAPRGVAHLEGFPRTDHADALPPEVGAVCEGVDEGALVADEGGEHEPVAEDFGCGEVDEVPVVGAVGVGEIELGEGVAALHGVGVVDEAFGGCPLELCDQQEESAEAYFVPRAVEEGGDFVGGEVVGVACDLACLRDAQSEELVAFAVLAFCCLEEAHEDLALLVVALRLHVLDDVGGGGCGVGGCGHRRAEMGVWRKCIQTACSGWSSGLNGL